MLFISRMSQLCAVLRLRASPGTFSTEYRQVSIHVLIFMFSEFRSCARSNSSRRLLACACITVDRMSHEERLTDLHNGLRDAKQINIKMFLKVMREEGGRVLST